MRSEVQASLRSAIRRIEGRWETGGERDHHPPSTGPFPEAPFQRLSRGATHEWFGLEPEGARSGWTPPLSVLTHLARRSLEAMQEEEGAGCVLWIGRRCWPYPRALLRADEHERSANRDLLRRSIFVDPPSRGERVWAIDLALRCPAAAAVVADGSDLRMAETRRLQLAASAGRAVGLIARPMSDRIQLSAAQTRWRVACAPSSESEPRWSVELLRCKGVQPVVEEARRWFVQRSHETGDVRVGADVSDRAETAARAETRSRRSA